MALWLTLLGGVQWKCVQREPTIETQVKNVKSSDSTCNLKDMKGEMMKKQYSVICVP